jgi:quinolinate synthase
MRTVTLAHYYTIPEVQVLADKVGDSLELAMYARDSKADVIVFAGVKFMAETAKILNPTAKVILPNINSTCSLVTQTDISALKSWREKYADYVHVSYINSSAEHKALSDWIVTSRNADDVIAHLYKKGNKVIFSPDYNMGAYLNSQYGYDMPLWSAVCEVHDKFNLEALEDIYQQNSSKSIYLIAHPESTLPILSKADFIGSTTQMLNWVRDYSGNVKDSLMLIATESHILYNMGLIRPDLHIMQAPIYNGCQCNSCPYMGYNTVQAVKDAQQGNSGAEINYLTDELMQKSLIPLERMLEFSVKYYK